MKRSLALLVAAGTAVLILCIVAMLLLGSGPRNFSEHSFRFSSSQQEREQENEIKRFAPQKTKVRVTGSEFASVTLVNIPKSANEDEIRSFLEELSDHYDNQKNKSSKKLSVIIHRDDNDLVVHEPDFIQNWERAKLLADTFGKEFSSYNGFSSGILGDSRKYGDISKCANRIRQISNIISSSPMGTEKMYTVIHGCAGLSVGMETGSPNFEDNASALASLLESGPKVAKKTRIELKGTGALEIRYLTNPDSTVKAHLEKWDKGPVQYIHNPLPAK